MTARKRMSAEERKMSIINVAKPLFAEKGFNGTSIRHIAKTANVSEALLYKHFPSKEAMYKEILTYTRRLSDITLAEIEEMEPSTENLVFLVYFLFQVIMFDVPGEEGMQNTHERLLFYSMLEDVEYASMVFEKLQDLFYETIELHYQAAVDSGDLVVLDTNLTNRFWFVHHLAMALNLCHLHDNPAFSYESSKEELANDAIQFALRGIGLTNEAIKAYFKPKKLRLFFKGLLADNMK